MELSNEQRFIINESTDKSVLNASAACGKTRVLTEKARRLLRDGVNPYKIAIITFTNMAAHEMRDRLKDDYKEGLYIGTIHGLANQLLLRNGFDTERILSSKDDDKYDKLFAEAKKYKMYLPQYNWLLIDEAQDSNEQQYEFIFDTLSPTHFLLVGDIKQAIYSFNGKTAEPFKAISSQPGVKTFDMTENFRNGANILAFAKQKIAPSGYFDKSRPQRGVNGTVTERSYTNTELKNLINNSSYDYKDWCVLINRRMDIGSFMLDMNKKGIPCQTFKQGENSKEELEKIMSSNTVKVLTPWSAKGLEWTNVIVKDTKRTGQVEDCYENILYVCATRARDNLYWFPPYRKKTKSVKFGDKVFEWEQV